MKRILLGGVVGGVVLFAWGFVVHMVLPVWKDAIRYLPPEGSVESALKGELKEPGVYFFPGTANPQNPSKEEEEAWHARIRTGPRGLIVFAEGAEPLSIRQLWQEAASNVVAAFLVSLTLYFLRGGFFARVLVCTLFGAVAWISITFSYWNWDGFSLEFAQADLIEQAGGWFLTGLALGAIVRPAPRFEGPRG